MRPLPKPAVPESSKPAVSRDRIQAALEKIGHVGSFPETLADKLATALGAVSEPSKQVGGSDVCETCAAHCVVLDDQDREIARLKAKLKSAPIVSREAILAALRASRVRGIVIENLLSWESPEWLATVLAEKLGVKGDT